MKPNMDYPRTRWFACWCGLVALAVFHSAAAASAGDDQPLPEGVQVAGLRVWPESIALSGQFDYRQLLVLGEVSTGETVDLTRRLAVEENSLVAVSPQGLVTPRADGSGELVVRYEGHEARIPLQVRKAQEAGEVSFVRDVQPALSRMGCNAGTCHGSKDGKNGFKLSLRGYDPLYDHRALTDDIGARRFNRAAPDQSLMLLKATGSIPHVGGVLTSTEHPYYAIIRRWIAGGARLDLEQPRVVSIEVRPQNPVLPRANMQQQMAVIAAYSDGSVRDVTREAFVESGNIEVAESQAGGLVNTLRRGEAPVLVRYEGAYAATTITVMGDRSGFHWPEPEPFNYIDELVFDKLQRVKVAPSELCTDAEFLRRAYLDLTGLPPTIDQAQAFLNDPAPSREKRDRLIDQLVGNGEYIEHWTNKWADLLQVNRKFLGEAGSASLRDWIKQSVAANRPYNEFAYEVLTASGSTADNPAASYYKILREPDALMENTTHLFLAIRFNCNKCHDHPFERWTQDQYYNLAAYFAQVGLKEDPAFAGQKIGGSAVEGAKPLVEVVFDKGQGEVTHDRTGQVTPPKFPYEHPGDVPGAASRREQLAAWITAPENPYFAKSFVNRLWGYLFGVGVIEPIDDIRAGNPPTNPQLLEALTRDFVESGFDVQHMLKAICKSRTYQLSVRTNPWNEDDSINFSHAAPRRLSAEMLYDAIHLAAGSQQVFPGLPAGLRAAELPDAGVDAPFLDDFGRPARESSCECERSSGMVLGPIMKLVNGPTVARAINDPNNALAQLAAGPMSDQEVLQQVFVRFLSRPPTEQELEIGMLALREAGNDLQLVLDELAAYEAGLPDLVREWEQRQGRPAVWTVLAPGELTATSGAALEVQEDQSVLVTGAKGKAAYTAVLETTLDRITGLRIEALADKRLPAGGPGRAPNGNFVLSRIKVQVAPVGAGDDAWTDVALDSASGSFNQNGFPPANALNDNDRTGWAVAPQFNKSHVAVFQFQQDAPGAASGMRVRVTLDQQFDEEHQLGKFRLALTNSPRPVKYQDADSELARLLSVPENLRSPRHKAELEALYRKQDSQLRELEDRVKLATQQREHRRLSGLQDLAWALINNPAFLFNH